MLFRITIKVLVVDKQLIKSSNKKLYEKIPYHNQ